MAPDGFTQIESRSESESAPAPTIADVIRHLEADPGIDRRRQREMCSALRSICRVLGEDPAALPAQPRQLRVRLSPITAAAAGLSAGRWANLRSLALKALRRAGIRAMPGRYREPHAPEWETLRARLPGRHFQSGLTRFMSYCTARGIAPGEVTRATFEAFGAELEEHSLSRDPGGVYRDSCKLWNQAAKHVLGWPQLQVPVPNRRRDFALTLDAFPRSFQIDVDCFLAERTDPDVFSDIYAKPVRPLTLRNRRRNILMAATALLHSGFPVEKLTGLAVLVDPANTKALLRFLLQRAGGATTGHIHQIATLLKTIAKHFTHMDERSIDELRGFSRKLKPNSAGLTEKNKRCLRQFADPKKLAALLTLPRRLFDPRSHCRGGDRRREAVRAALGLAIGIELIIPIRAHNLAGLRIDRHILRVGNSVLLSIPAAETKNDSAIEAELPPWLVSLLNEYLDRYRPRLIAAPSPWLFPGENGGQRPSGGFAAQISALIASETGITMTLHQFRHLAAKLYLDRRSGDYETVRRLLAHKSLVTTMKFYRELDVVLAVKRYGDLLEQLLDEAEASAAGGRRTRRAGR